MAIDRKNKNKPKIDRDGHLKNYIVEKLIKERWSPRTIAGAWRLENPDTKISTEAIYQWIYSEEGEKLSLKKSLVRARKKRGFSPRSRKSKIKNRVSIHRRPDRINQRSEFGHYECDLIFNSGSQSKNVCTLIERVTRHATLIRNESKHSKTVIGSLIEQIQATGMFIKSITFDNGSEFGDHTQLNELGIETYFCDPGTPSQKGSIENLNGVLRRYLPFEQDAQEITSDRVADAAIKVNNMPRAILGFKTSIDAYNQALREVRA
jgi:IS30 family transposase